MELFWKRIERVVWEGEKRKLLRQLHEKKRKKLDRLVRQAMKKCKLLARGLRESVRTSRGRKRRRRERGKYGQWIPEEAEVGGEIILETHSPLLVVDSASPLSSV